MLGLSWEFIKRKATILFGAPAMKLLEKGMEIFQILRKDGLAGLWEHIKDQFQDLKETVIENIKSMLVTQVIEAGVKWLLSLLIPGAGFVKAIIAIKDFIVFFVESAIMLIPAMIEAIQALAAGNVSGIAVAIETGLGILIPLLISLFARLIGLGSVVKKVQKIIEKIRKKISEKVTKFLKSIKERVKTFLKKLGFGKKKKGKKDKESGKSKGDGEIGETIDFRAGDEKHTLWIKDAGNAKLMVASKNPKTVTAKLDEWDNASKKGWSDEKKGEVASLISEARNIEKPIGTLLKKYEEIEKKNKKADKPNYKKLGKIDSEIEESQDQLYGILKKLFIAFDEKPVQGFVLSRSGIEDKEEFVVEPRNDNKFVGYEVNPGGNYIVGKQENKYIKAREENQDYKDEIKILNSKTLDERRKHISKGAVHTKYKPKSIEAVAEGNGIVVKYDYIVIRDGKEERKQFTTTITVNDGLITQHTLGKNLRLKDGGRGYTDSVNNVKANEALKGLKKKEFEDAEIKFNAAHQIADWFEGSGYKKTLNLLTTSEKYNTGEMLRAERKMAAKIEEIQDNVDTFITFDLNVTSKYRIITDDDIVKSLLKRNMIKEDAESAKGLLDKHTDPVLVEEVVYSIGKYYIGGNNEEGVSIRIVEPIGRDNTLFEILD